MTELSDLDLLLEESVALADARRAKTSGRKLTQTQAEILEANALAEAQERWESQEVYAWIAEKRCVCGGRHKVFQGWYIWQTLRKGEGQRLIAAEGHEGLPAAVYQSEEEVQWCLDCAPEGLPLVGAEQCELLEELGLGAEAPEQLELDLEGE